MSNSTYANPDLASDGKNKDSSGVYFDENGTPNVNSGAMYSNPYIEENLSYTNTIDKLKTYDTFLIRDGYIGILKSAHINSYENILLHAVNHLGLKETKDIALYFREEDPKGNKFTRRIPTNWWYTDAPEWRINLSDIKELISIENAVFLDELKIRKFEQEESFAIQLSEIAATRQSDIKTISKTLGISSDDAIAYLAAGHSVKDATDKVAKWNLASPSQRKFLIAQDAILGNEASNRGEEFVLGKEANIIKHEAKPVDDMYKGIRKPYSEKNSSKAYIALVREKLSESDAFINQESGIFTLIKLEEFYMQSVSEVDSEKYQIVETFNKPKIYFFDRRARVYQYSFIVENNGRGVDGEGNQWRDLFKNTYDEYLRGTKSVEKRVKAVIHYDEVTRIGYVLSCSMNMDSQNDNMAQVSITMFVEDEQQRNVPPNVNEGFENPEVKKAEAQAIADPKKTISHIEAIYGSSKGITSITISDYLNNLLSPLNTLQKPLELFIREIYEGGQGEISQGDAIFVESIANVTYSDGSSNEITNPDGLVLKLDPKRNIGIAIGSKLPIKKEGTNVFVSLDVRSKFVQDIYVKQNGKKASVKYEIRIKSTDQKITSITGNMEISPSVIVSKVKDPGTVDASDRVDNKERLIEINVNKIKPTPYQPTEANNFYVYEGKFTIETVDLKSESSPVALTGESYKNITFEVKDVLGSLTDSSQDKGKLSGEVIFKKLSSTVLECNVKLLVQLDATNKVAFTGKSASLVGSAKIGSVDLNVKLLFTKVNEKQSFSLLTAKSQFDVNNPLQLSVDESSSIKFYNRIDLIFDADPGDIFRKLQFEVDKDITSRKGNELNSTGKSSKFEIRASNTLIPNDTNGIFAETEIVKNVNVSIKLIQASSVTTLPAKNAIELYKIPPGAYDNVYVLSCNLEITTENSTYNILGGLVSYLNSKSISRIKSGKLSGIIKVSGSESSDGAVMQSQINSSFINTNPTKTRISS